MDYFIVFIFIFVYVIFVIYEAVLETVSVSSHESISSGSFKARRIASLADDSSHFVSRLQINSVLISVFVGSFCGLRLVAGLPVFSNATVSHFGSAISDLAVVVVIALVSGIIHTVGRIVVRAAEFRNPEKKLESLFWPVMTFYCIFYPVTWVVENLSNLVSYVFGIRSTEGRAMTQEDIMDMLDESSEQGVLDKEESEMIRDVFDFSDTKANELMTPRKDVVYLDKSMTREQIVEIAEEAHYSKYPVMDGSPDEIIGILSVKDLLRVSEDSSFDLRSYITKPLYIPETLEARKVVEIFKDERQKFGIVVDEYGGVEGIITLHDLVESIFGVINDEDEVEEPEVVKCDDGRYMVSGTMNLSDFMEYFSIDDYGELEEEDFTTVGGLATYLVGEIPVEGTDFSYRNLRMKVLKMDNRRVDRISVEVCNEVPESENSEK